MCEAREPDRVVGVLSSIEIARSCPRRDASHSRRSDEAGVASARAPFGPSCYREAELRTRSLTGRSAGLGHRARPRCQSTVVNSIGSACQESRESKTIIGQANALRASTSSSLIPGPTLLPEALGTSVTAKGLRQCLDMICFALVEGR